TSTGPAIGLPNSSGGTQPVYRLPSAWLVCLEYSRATRPGAYLILGCLAEGVLSADFPCRTGASATLASSVRRFSPLPFPSPARLGIAAVNQPLARACAAETTSLLVPLSESAHFIQPSAAVTFAAASPASAARSARTVSASSGWPPLAR